MASCVTVHATEATGSARINNVRTCWPSDTNFDAVPHEIGFRSPDCGLRRASDIYTACPAQNPDAQAHWKLKPPRWPVTSTTSPTKYRPGTLRHSMVLEESSLVSTPPAVTSAFS